MTRVLVCGGRGLMDLGLVWGQLDAFHAIEGPISVVIHGGAKGADSLADSWAYRNGVPAQPYPVSDAEWKRHGKRAGPMRNRWMLADGKPDIVIAFPGGLGTANMISQARAAEVKVQLIEDAMGGRR